MALVITAILFIIFFQQYNERLFPRKLKIKKNENKHYQAMKEKLEYYKNPSEDKKIKKRNYADIRKSGKRAHKTFWIFSK